MTKKKVGRKDVYTSKIEPRMKDILRWLEQGATEREVANNLGVAYSTFNKYKGEKTELMELLKKGREKPVEDIKAALLRRAVGFQYEEKKVVTKKIVMEGSNGASVPANVIQTEVVTKTALPDVAAGLVLLKHWDKQNGWTSDPQTLELKKKELEFKKEQAEKESW